MKRPSLFQHDTNAYKQHAPGCDRQGGDGFIPIKSTRCNIMRTHALSRYRLITIQTHRMPAPSLARHDTRRSSAIQKQSDRNTQTLPTPFGGGMDKCPLVHAPSSNPRGMSRLIGDHCEGRQGPGHGEEKLAIERHDRSRTMMARERVSGQKRRTDEADDSCSQ